MAGSARVGEAAAVLRARSAPAAWAALACLCLIALLLLGALLAYVLLFVNVPSGYNSRYALGFGSVEAFRAIYPYPRLDLSASAFGSLGAATLGLLWCLYFGAAAVVRGPLTGEPRVAAVIFGFAVLFHLTLFALMPPVLSSDVYHYAAFGRMLVGYGINPYVVPPAAAGPAAGREPIWAYLDWPELVTPYGPAWTLLSAALARLGGHDPLAIVFLWKGVAVAASLLIGWIIWRLARQLLPGSEAAALVAFTWNPLVIIEVAGSGHNDVVMIAAALAGVLAIARSRPHLGVALLTLSVLVKYLTALLTILLVVYLLRRQSAPGARLRLLVRAVVVALGVTLLCLLPLGVGPEVLGGPVFHAGEAAGRNPSQVALRELAATGLAAVVEPAQTRRAAAPIIALALYLGFVAFLAWGVLSIWRGGGELRRVLVVFGIAALAYVTVIYGWNYPWYLVSPLAVASVVVGRPGGRRLLTVTNAVGLFLSLLYPLLVPWPPTG